MPLKCLTQNKIQHFLHTSQSTCTSLQFGIIGNLVKVVSTYNVIQCDGSIICTEHFCSKPRHQVLQVCIQPSCIKFVKEIISRWLSYKTRSIRADIELEQMKTEERNNSKIPRRKPSIALYTSSSTSTVLKYLIESLPRKSNCKVNAKSYIQTASELRSHIVILSKHAEY